MQPGEKYPSYTHVGLEPELAARTQERHPGLTGDGSVVSSGHSDDQIKYWALLRLKWKTTWKALPGSLQMWVHPHLDSGVQAWSPRPQHAADSEKSSYNEQGPGAVVRPGETRKARTLQCGKEPARGKRTGVYNVVCSLRNVAPPSHTPELGAPAAMSREWV